MNCPACGFENPDGMKFCGNCAKSLRSLQACPSCGFENPPGFKFCGECASPLAGGREPSADRDPRDYTPRHLADKILHTRPTLEGERKQVTVLFADVRGSLELSEVVDPEEWHRILDRFFQILTDGVHRFEGTVNQYTGDGIMALFGAPIAHEDHAQRACYAALHLREVLGRYSDELRVGQGIDFSVRMGVNSGEVVVGKIGDDLRMDYTAQGHTVGLAARMEQIAAANSIALSDATAKLVEGYVELRPLGETRVKGVSEPVAVHELRGVGAIRTRLEASRARGFSKFVGRGDELATLESDLERAVAGEGQVVGVVANAGIGKSRLCLEFIERCGARGIAVREAHCLAHGRTVPRLPVLELLRQVFEIADDDSARSARTKIAGAMLMLDRELEESLPLVFELLGVPDEAEPGPDLPDEVRERRIVDIVRRFLQARSQREPGVILVEDLHWIDPASETFLQHLVDVVPSTRTLLLVNFRPEYHADWMQRPSYRQLPLRPLGPEEIGELLRNLLGSHASLQGLGERIRERTGGNPFFIEEVVRTLAETGRLDGPRGAYRLAGPIEALEIPPSVQPLLASRIDRLGEREKQVLRAASVLGEQVAEGVLREMVDLPDGDLAAALHQLVAAEFLHEVALYPEPEYAFHHPLTEEVAYRSQLAERRAGLHARAARALEARIGEGRGERAALLAHHWDAAGEKLPAARWHRLAAQRAGLLHLRDAHRHWSRVRALSDELPEEAEAEELGTVARVQMFTVGARLSVPEEEMEKLFRECEAIVERSGSEEGRARLLIGYGSYRHYVTGNAREASRALAEATELADRLGSLEQRLGARSASCMVLVAHDMGRALRTAEEALELLRTHPEAGGLLLPGGFPPAVAFRFLRTVALIQIGRLAAARDDLTQLKHLVREREEALGYAHVAASYLAMRMGDLAGAERESALSIEHGEVTGNPSGLVIGLANLGGSLVWQGRAAEAIAPLERALGIHREQRIFRQIEAGPLTSLALARLQLGELERAEEIAQEALVFTRERGLLAWEATVQRCLAEIALAREGAAAAPAVERALERAEELVDRTGWLADRPALHELRAELAAVTGDATERDRQLQLALDLYEEMGATGHLQRLRAAL